MQDLHPNRLRTGCAPDPTATASRLSEASRRDGNRASMAQAGGRGERRGSKLEPNRGVEGADDERGQWGGTYEGRCREDRVRVQGVRWSMAGVEGKKQCVGLSASVVWC
jgi:hypothetical protein